ncbi:MAG: MATE family efflux transporter, partial [Pseudomonadota bacterium]
MRTPAFSLNDRRHRLLTGPVSRVLFDLSWPMSVGLLSVIAINVTDTFYLGRLGGDELGALGFCFPVIFGMSAIAIGMGNGGAAVVSRALGAEKTGEAKALITATLLFTMLFALCLAFIMLRISDAVFLALGAPESLLGLINSYMTVWYWGLPLFVAPIVLNGLVRATGEAMVPSVLMVIAAALNAMISPLIIFGLWDFPALGMTGAALASVIARVTIMLLGVAWLVRADLLSIGSAALKQFFPCTAEVLKYGAPAFLAQLAGPVGGAIATRILASAGPEAVAGFAVGARIEALALIPFFALQTGVTPFIGQNLGAGKTDRLRCAERDVWRFALLWGGVGGLVLWCCGGTLSSAFTSDEAISTLSDHYLEAIALGLWGAGLLIAGIGIINPLGYPNVALATSALRFLGLYAGLALALFAGFGWSPTQAVFTAAGLSFAVSGLAASGIFHVLLSRADRKHGVLDKPELAPR